MSALIAVLLSLSRPSSATAPRRPGVRRPALTLGSASSHLVADDDPLDVVARSVAADVAPGEFDRSAVGGEGDPLDEQRRPARRPGRAAAPRGRAGAPARGPRGPGRRGSRSARQQLVEGVVLEVRGEEAREALRRQVDLLEEQRLAAGEPEALEVERRRAELQLERLRRRPRRPTPAAPRRAASRGPGRGSASRSVKLGCRRSRGRGADGGRTCPRPRVRSMRCSRASSDERAPDGDQAAAVALGELALRRQSVARPPLARVERRRPGRGRPGGAAGRDRARAGSGPSSGVDPLARRAIGDNVISNHSGQHAPLSRWRTTARSERGTDRTEAGWASRSRSSAAAAPTRRS